MKLLVLGGTRFLGRHVVEAALQRGHDVTLFTRGRAIVPWADQVTMLVGDRDPEVTPGIAAIAQGEWDAVVDTSGYVPRVVGASAKLLRPRVGRYLFVSSISAYALLDRPGMDEDAPLARLPEPGSEQVLEHYGALKAACEHAVLSTFAKRATIVRPGLIVGPYDATDRFGYWVARFVHPHLLGDRGDRAVVPAPAGRAIQLIDARDLATFMLDLLAHDLPGAFNATSDAGRWTMGDLIAALRAASPNPLAPVWIDSARLLAAGVEPWVGLPLWIPATDADHAGMMHVDVRRALGAGLTIRSLDETIRATAAWLTQRDNSTAWKLTLSGQRERELLAT